MAGMAQHEMFMDLALEQARTAASEGEVPVGAVVVKDGVVIASGRNARENDNDPTAHAELIAIRRASEALGSWRLSGCTVYVTLEPCPMCAGAMMLSRIDQCVFGTKDPKGGFCGSLEDISSDVRLNHQYELVTGVRREACSAVLRDFFRELRRR